MTLNALQLWRKAIPFLISFACVVPWISIRDQGARECALIVTLAGGTAFLYVILGISKPRWDREMESYVKTQIRENLITLIPENLDVTTAEREQLANSEILKELTGIFWEIVDQNGTLRSQKQYFYSNGLVYSTAVDGFLLLTSFGFCYAMAGLILRETRLLPWAVGLIGLGLVCRILAIPRIRQRHLALSREQLDLLKREEGEVVAGRFRKIVLDWRARGRPGISAPPAPRRSAAFWREGVAAVLVLIAFSALAMMSRGWFGPGPGVRLAPDVKYTYVSEGPHDKFAAVVFVHGIFGTKEDSWVSPGHTRTFPGLLSNDPSLRDKVDVFAFEYYTPKFGAAPSIVDLDDQLRGALDDKQLFENHTKVVFLAHSMGGIVVRHFLLNHQDRIEKVPMVFFYATPTNGSEMAAVGQLVSNNPQLGGMVPLEGNELLQSIQSGWLNSEKAKSIASYCAVEELPTFGVMIVTRSSATSLCNRALDPFSANHLDIVKPTDREDPRYTRFVSALRREVLTPSKPASAPVAPAIYAKQRKVSLGSPPPSSNKGPRDLPRDINSVHDILQEYQRKMHEQEKQYFANHNSDALETSREQREHKWADDFEPLTHSLTVRVGEHGFSDDIINTCCNAQGVDSYEKLQSVIEALNAVYVGLTGTAMPRSLVNIELQKDGSFSGNEIYGGGLTLKGGDHVNVNNNRIDGGGIDLKGMRNVNVGGNTIDAGDGPHGHNKTHGDAPTPKPIQPPQ